MKEQLPTLKLLLDFMKKVYVKPIVSTNETEGALTDTFKVCKDMIMLNNYIIFMYINNFNVY